MMAERIIKTQNSIHTLTIKMRAIKTAMKGKSSCDSRILLKNSLELQCGGDCLFPVAQNNTKKQLCAWVVKAGN